MPITTSAKKALRGSIKKRDLNDARRAAMQKAAKAVKKLVATGKTAEAKEALALAYKAVDKAAKRGLLKRNTAARRKSQLARLFSK
jgi:small subunit ribosomal protein S20